MRAATARAAAAVPSLPPISGVRSPSAKAPSTKQPGPRSAPARSAATSRKPAAPATGYTGTGAPTAADRGGPPARERRAPRHSAVEALLAEHVGEQPVPTAPPTSVADRLAETLRADAARAGADLSRPSAAPVRGPAAQPSTAPVAPPPLPPADDLLVGLAALLAEQFWRIGTRGVEVVTRVTTHVVGFVRAVSPQFATAEADSRLAALAERGRRVRAERAEAMSSAVTTAITSAATSDAVRQMTIAAIEEATDDVLAVVLPAMIEAVSDQETQDKLDALMAGLLVRQLPSALEKTLPVVMLRTATRPAAGLMPFLGGVLPRG